VRRTRKDHDVTTDPAGQWNSNAQVMPPPPKNGAATWSLVLAILALVLCWLSVVGVFVGSGGVIGFGLIPIVLALIAIVLGIAGTRRASRQGARGRGVAIGGLIVGIVALIASVVITISAAVFLVVVPGGLGQSAQQFQQCLRQQAVQGTPADQIQQICAQQAGQQVQKQVGGG
jgi:hypothetical protein